MEDKKTQILKMAENLFGVKKIKAYNLAGRSDLAQKYANELLIAEHKHDNGPWVWSPYTANKWEVLEQKTEFDKHNIRYNPETVKLGLLGSDIRMCSDEPSKSGIRNIEEILTNHDCSTEERNKFFVKLRDRAKKDLYSHEMYQFVMHRKETGYSNLAEHTGVERKEVVTHYLKNLFEPKEFHSLMWNWNDWYKELSKFIQKENVNNEQIINLAEKTMRDFKPEGFGSSKSDKHSFCYYALKGLSQIPGIKIPKKMVVKTLRDYISTGGTLDEEIQGISPVYRDIKDDPEIYALREKAFKQEMHNPCRCSDQVKYGIREFGLNPRDGWLRKAFETNIKELKESDDKKEISAAINAGKKYNLLSKDEIANLEERLEIVKLLD